MRQSSLLTFSEAFLRRAKIRSAALGLKNHRNVFARKPHFQKSIHNLCLRCADIAGCDEAKREVKLLGIVPQNDLRWDRYSDNAAFCQRYLHASSGMVNYIGGLHVFPKNLRHSIAHGELHE